LRIGIVGCGAIGSFLARKIAAGFSGRACLAGVYDIDRNKARALAAGLRKPDMLTVNLKALIRKSDLVVEATRAESSAAIASQVLSSGKDAMVMSVGGVIDRLKALESVGRRQGARIFIPSGAICGIDGLKAASCDRIKRVVLTTTKPGRAFADVPYVLKKKLRLEGLKKDLVIFEGSARQAVKAFPKNINVAATLSLAGVGPEKTVVRIVASAGASRNTHEIEITGNAGKIITRTENVVHPDNPKTSYLAALSALAALRQVLDPVKIGT